MPALFTRDTNTPTTMSGANPFQSLDGAAKATGQENQMQEAQQHKQVLEKKAAVDTKYVSLAGRWSREEEMGARWNIVEERMMKNIVAHGELDRQSTR
jgi:hypothetical protein